MIEFEFALQTWGCVAESLDAAGIDSRLPSHGPAAERGAEAEGAGDANVA